MLSPGEQIVNPLPQRYVTSEASFPGIGGTIKARPEDFLVDEIPLYDPQGEGEHLYVGVEKTNVSHGEMMSCLRRFFNVREAAIGFAGMKDKRGITRQTVSIQLRDDPPHLELDHARIKLLWAKRHRNKLRLGHLAGNRFSIRIRDVSAARAPQALRTLKKLEADGVPNYFGAQRFGYRRNNHLIGASVLRGEWEAVIRLLLSAEAGNFPEYQRSRRESFDAGRFKEALLEWTPADRNERIVCGAIARGRSPRDAALAVGPTAISFWISALQSAVFNRVLDQRIEGNCLNHLVEGDLAWRHDNRSVFRVTVEELAKPELAERLKRIEISPSGPIWGVNMLQPGEAVAEQERQALEASGMSIDSLGGGKHSPPPEGGRRPLRVPLLHASLDAGIDEHGEFIRAAFDLPRGSYATVVLREIMKTDHTDADEQHE